MINRVNKKILYISSFFIPIFLYLCIFYKHGIWPFGDITIMTGDMHYQFIDYLSYLKSIVFGNNDLNYSFSQNLGGNITGFVAYYYLSPLNLITLLFPSSMLPVAEGIILMLYSGLSSLSFTYMLSKLHGYRYANIIFALSYSMMGFVATYFQLTMYFSNLILLPLVILGLHNLMHNPNNHKLYMISLFMSVLFNYYIGYMTCIFVTVYFIYCLIINCKSISEIKNKFDVIKSFAVSSVLGATLSMFNLLPAVFSLSGEKDNISIGLSRMFPMHKVFSQFFTGAFDGNVSTGLPNIFAGISMVSFAGIYFFAKKYDIRERFASFVLIAFLFINLYINPLNVAWHGFNQPIGFPYRYSFFISFLVILFAYKGFMALNESVYIKILGLIAALVAIYAVIAVRDAGNGVGLVDIILDCSITLIVILMILLKSKGILKLEILALALFILNTFDLTYNAYDAMNYYNLASLSEYQTYLSDVNKKLAWLNENDTGFYRIEKYFRRTNNDAMQFNYPGLSHFSSSEKKDKINFLGKLGFRNNGNWAFYNESTTRFLDSFLGVKYIISQHSSTPNHYTKLTPKDIYRVFGNESAFPLLFTASDSINDINYNAYSNNPFELQQAIADTLKSDNRIFTKAEPESINLVNLNSEKQDGVTHYKKIDKTKDAKIEYEFKIDEKYDMFVYFDAPETQKAHLYCDGLDRDKYFDTYRWNIVNLYDYEIGKKVKVELELLEDSLDITNAYFYYENSDNVDVLGRKMADNDVKLEKITSSHLKGSIDVNEESGNTAVLSIPYDTGWNVYVDGAKVKTDKAVGMLLSFKIDEGLHNIELKYFPRGRMEGIIISLISLIIIIAIEIKIRRDGA